MGDGELLVSRTLPIVVWTLVVLTRARAIDPFEPDPEMRTRRRMPIWLVEGAAACLFVGALGVTDRIPGGLASLAYTVLGFLIVIVGIVLLLTIPKPPQQRS